MEISRFPVIVSLEENNIRLEHPSAVIESRERLLAVSIRSTAKSIFYPAMPIDDTTTLSTFASNSEIKHTNMFQDRCIGSVRPK